MKKIIPLALGISLFSSYAFGGCINYREEYQDNPGLTPKVTLCSKGKCEKVELVYLCGDVKWNYVEYANGLLIIFNDKQRIFKKEISKGEYKIINSKDWSCRPTKGDYPNNCWGFNGVTFLPI